MISTLNSHATSLADPTQYNKQIVVTPDVAIELIEYKNLCDLRANELKDHEDLQKTELSRSLKQLS